MMGEDFDVFESFRMVSEKDVLFLEDINRVAVGIGDLKRVYEDKRFWRNKFNGLNNF